jgi:Lon protease-like protein
MPLSSVLLPNQATALHLFEARYVGLLSECIAKNLPFGIALIREGREVGDPDVEPYLVGTFARFVAKKTISDRRTHAIALGEGRFRIRSFDRSEPLLKASVEPILEARWVATERNQNLLDEARAAFRSHLETVFGGSDVGLRVARECDPMTLSFSIAGCLDVPSTKLQHLLEMTDTAERLEEMIPLMEMQTHAFAMTAQPSHLDLYAEYLSSN